MVLWWAAFFVSGLLFPTTAGDGLLLSAFPFILLAAVSERWRSAAALPRPVIRFLIICSCGILLWAGAGRCMEGHREASSGHSSFETLRRTPFDYDRYIGLSAGRKGGAAGGLKRCDPMPAVRNRLLVSIDGAPLSTRAVKLVGALVLGSREKLGREIREIYRYMGTAHFLALSGLHLGIIAMPIARILFFAPINKTLRDILLLAALTIYAAIAGFPPSLLRALALAGAVVLHRSLGSGVDLMRSLVAGGLLLALLDFPLVLDAGFQLSFTAVCGIALIGIPLISRIDSFLPKGPAGRLAKVVLVPVIVTCSVQFLTLPLVLRLFNRCSLAAPLMNLLLVLPVTAALYLGAAYIFLPLDWLRAGLAIPLNATADLLWKIPSFFSRSPHPALHTGDINAFIFLAGAAALALSLGRRCGRRPLLALAALGVILASLLTGAGPGDTGLPACPVAGSGTGCEANSCCFVPDGSGVLFILDDMELRDAERIVGELWRSGRGSVGTMVVTPSGIRRRGLLHLAERIAVKEILCSPYLLEGEEWLCGRLGRLCAFLHPVSKGDTVVRGGVRLRILAPRYPPVKGGGLPGEGARLRFEIETNSNI